MKFSERLLLARKKAGLSQAELAQRSGVTQPTISQLENSDTDTGSAHTVRFARACGVSPDWLDDEIGPMIPAPVTVLATGEPAPQHLRELLDLCYALDGEDLREVIGTARYLRNKAAERAAAKQAKSSG